MMTNMISRRTLLAGTGLLLGGSVPSAAAPGKLKVTIFSKHLQFVQGDEIGALDIPVSVFRLRVQIEHVGQAGIEQRNQGSLGRLPDIDSAGENRFFSNCCWHTDLMPVTLI